MHHNQLELNQGVWSYFATWKLTNIIYHINKLKKKSYMIILKDTRQKSIWQKPALIHGKMSQQTKNRWEHPQFDQKNLHKVQS